MTATGVCSACGERNPPGTQFCVVCQNYLGWDKTMVGPPGGAVRPQPDAAEQQAAQTQLVPRVGRSGSPGIPTNEGARTAASGTTSGTPTAGQTGVGAGRGIGGVVGAGGSGGVGATSGPGNRGDLGTIQDTGVAAAADLVADDRFRVTAENPNVTVSPLGDVAELEVRVSNLSIRVDGYLAEARTDGIGAAPSWLVVKSSPVELLPGTDDLLRVRFQVVAPQLVPAQLVVVPLRVRAMNEPAAAVELFVAVTVSVVDAPLQLRAEPRLLRVQDRADAVLTVTLDNSNCNQTVRAELAGTDPELAVRFEFDPPVVEVGPAAMTTVRARVSAEPPPPGQELARSLTISAKDAQRSVETPVTFVQRTSVAVEDPVVGLQLEPALIRVRDNPVGVTRLLIDNRNGRDWAHLQLSATDPEQAVSVGFDAPQIHVPPGQTVQTQLRLHAALPELGTEANRTVTITARDAKQRTATAVATYVQVSSASPMTTLGIRVEPEVIRVHDADGASAQVVLDNRKGRFRVRLQLAGADPERAVGFAFGPPVVEVEPGQARTVELRLAAWRPPPGQEWTRQFTVSASDGQTSVEAKGSLVLSSSRSAMETLALRLDPSVLRLDRRRRGVVSLLIDNRTGASPVRVGLAGDDPENCIRFSFSPAMVDVEPGRIVRANVNVDAPGAPAGQEITRTFSITASDGRADVQAAGTLVQSAGEKRPLARVLFTLFGAVLMIIGALLPWEQGGTRGVQITANLIASQFRFRLLLGIFEPFLSAGVAVIVLAVVMVFGLTGRSGRLTRWAAFGGVVVVVGVFVTFVTTGILLVPALGAILVAIGCVLGYVGGLLVKR